MRILFFVFAIFGTPAFATDICHDLWFTRNLIFDRAGYCFGSPLGQAVFDNGNCTTKSPAISDKDAVIVTRIREREGGLGCSVDTKSAFLDVDLLPLRMRLVDIPIPDQFESACIGYKEDVIVLFDGIALTANPIAQVQPGDTLVFSYESLGNSNFVTLLRDGALAGLGWTDIPIAVNDCVQWAG